MSLKIGLEFEVHSAEGKWRWRKLLGTPAYAKERIRSTLGSNYFVKANSTKTVSHRQQDNIFLILLPDYERFYLLAGDSLLIQAIGLSDLCVLFIVAFFLLDLLHFCILIAVFGINTPIL